MKTVNERPRRAATEPLPSEERPGEASPPDEPAAQAPRRVRSIHPPGAPFRDTSADTLELDQPPLGQFTARSCHGLVIADRYRLLDRIAEGGMGSVYIAEQVALGRKVAVKIVVDPDESLLDRMEREARALAEVSHPAIVEILDFVTQVDETSTRGCLVMAFIDGSDLRTYLAQQPEGFLDPYEVRVLMLPIVSALVELHAAGIVHRDIKPDNLVRFERADGRPGVTLVDFGIARRSSDMGITAVGTLLGTPPYMSPEILHGELHTPRADLYALGATMVELLTGEPPNGKGPLSEILQRAMTGEVTFPSHLAGTAMAALLKRMLCTDPLERPDAAWVLRTLERMRSPLRSAATAGIVADPIAETRSLRRSRARRAPSVETQPVDLEETDAPPAPAPATATTPSRRTLTVAAAILLVLGMALGAIVLSLAGYLG